MVEEAKWKDTRRKDKLLYFVVLFALVSVPAILVPKFCPAFHRSYIVVKYDVASAGRVFIDGVEMKGGGTDKTGVKRWEVEPGRHLIAIKKHRDYKNASIDPEGWTVIKQGFADVDKGETFEFTY